MPKQLVWETIATKWTGWYLCKMLQRALRLRGRWISVSAPGSAIADRTPKSGAHPSLTLIFHYTRWWASSLFVLMMLLSWLSAPVIRPRLAAGPDEPGASILNKFEYYRRHSREFNLVLLGDSLTYTGLHPEFLDPALGTHSVNLAIFAHWFPTQYPLIKDLIPLIPKGTRVLWSIHNWDFQNDLSVQRTYPVGIPTAIRYWFWGARNPGLLDNVLYFNSFTRLLVARDEFRDKTINFGDQSISGAIRRIGNRFQTSPEIRGIPQTTAQSLPQPFQATLRVSYPQAESFAAPNAPADTPALRDAIIAFYGKFPSVARVEVDSEHGVVNSAVLFLKGGGYYRVELVPEFFRAKQREMERRVWHPSDADAERYKPPAVPLVPLTQFKAGLEAFRKAHIPVIVNMMEEAPYNFGNEIMRRKYRESQDAELRPIVESYGDDYVHADYSTITDADYFDYNHFNSRGIAKYTPLLVQKLRETPAFHHANGSRD